MPQIQKRNLNSPDEVRDFDKGHVDMVTLGDLTFGRATFQPGWRWSECVKPIAKTESCQVNHKSLIISGRMGVRLDDGTETEAGPGEVMIIPPGHDGWVIGDEACVSLDFDESSRNFAKPV